MLGRGVKWVSDPKHASLSVMIELPEADAEYSLSPLAIPSEIVSQNVEFVKT